MDWSLLPRAGPVRRGAKTHFACRIAYVGANPSIPPASGAANPSRSRHQPTSNPPQTGQNRAGPGASASPGPSAIERPICRSAPPCNARNSRLSLVFPISLSQQDARDSNWPTRSCQRSRHLPFRRPDGTRPLSATALPSSPWRTRQVPRLPDAGRRGPTRNVTPRDRTQTERRWTAFGASQPDPGCMSYRQRLFRPHPSAHPQQPGPRSSQGVQRHEAPTS
jgi:hypothetical protein